MATLNDIVNVQIALQTTGVVRGNFGTPIIVAPLMTFPERVRAYSSFAESAADNLPPPVVAALSAAFSQIPRPRQIKVGRRAVLKGVVDVATLVPAGVYTIKVNTTTYTFTADANPTAAEIVTGLAAQVALDTGAIITANAVANTLELAWIGTNIGSITLGTNLAWGLISPLSASTAVADDLNAILNIDKNWYGLVMAERVKQTQLDAAAWTEANERLFLLATSESDVLNPALITDIISELKNRVYYRSAILAHIQANVEYPDSAWASRVFTIQPGSETWALKGLSGITPSNYTTTQRNTIFAKGGNAFEKYGEIFLTNPGKVAAGEWVDVIRFRDWLKDTIQVNMAQMMINRDKIPYTDQGIQLIVNNLRKSLQEGVNVGGIAPDELDSNGNNVPGFVITYPLAADISPTIKATRVLTIGFTARIAGAIHVVEINGALAYEL